MIPRSHRFGQLSHAASAALRASTPEVACLAARGSVLAMRPILLHASSPATRPNDRRVLRVQDASQQLPHDLRWPEPPNVAAA